MTKMGGACGFNTSMTAMPVSEAAATVHACRPSTARPRPVRLPPDHAAPVRGVAGWMPQHAVTEGASGDLLDGEKAAAEGVGCDLGGQHGLHLPAVPCSDGAADACQDQRYRGVEDADRAVGHFGEVVGLA